MATLREALLESWDRQTRIILNLAEYVQPDWLDQRVSAEEFSIGEHLCHIHGTRRYWLSHVDPAKFEATQSLYTKEGEEYIASSDLSEIRRLLAQSSKAVRDAVEERLDDPGAAGPYDHIVYFLQHMVWHDGWHASSIMHALRANGHEPAEEWEDPNVWGQWRNYG